MKKKIIGYGSLLDHNGWNITLKKQRTMKDIEEVILKDYIRTWSAFSEVKIDNEIVDAVFLDITYDKGSYINGSAIEVNDYEFKEISMREYNYDMINVTDLVLNPQKDYEYYTAYYKLKKNNSGNKKFIMQKYIDIVEKALKNLSKEFNKTYKLTTKKSNYPIKNGKYIFTNKEVQKRV